MSAFVYVIQDGADGDVKIGWALDPRARLRDLQTGNPRELRLLYWERFAHKRAAARVERWLHEEFTGHRVRGEWFRFTGSLRELVLRCLDDGGATLLEQIGAWQTDAGLGDVA